VRHLRQPQLLRLKAETMPTGTVKYVDSARGYGFISRDDRQAKVFVHVTAVTAAGALDLRKGQRYSFDIDVDDRGQPFATNLLPI